MSDRYAQMFDLRPEEQAVLDGLDEDEKQIFITFRESFLFTMGGRDVMLHYLLLYARLNMDILSDIDTENFQPPEYLLNIRAPEHHVKSGKPGSEINAHKEVESGWSSLTFAIEQACIPNPLAEIVLRFMDDFISRDKDYVGGEMLKITEESIDKQKKGRVTVEDRRASFFRELFLSSKYDEYISERTMRLINVCRLHLENVIYALTLEEIAGDIESEIWNEAEKTVMEQYEELGATYHADDETFQGMHKGMVALKSHVNLHKYLKKIIPGFPELTDQEFRILKLLRELKAIWESKHPGCSFLSDYLKREEEKI